jgi:hypothetical protein
MKAVAIQTAARSINFASNTQGGRSPRRRDTAVCGARSQGADCRGNGCPQRWLSAGARRGYDFAIEPHRGKDRVRRNKKQLLWGGSP